MQITIPLTAILLILVASGLGTLAWAIGKKLAFPAWVVVWITLFVFGLVIVFGKVT